MNFFFKNVNNAMKFIPYLRTTNKVMCEEKNKKNKNLCKITQVLNSKAATQLQPV